MAQHCPECGFANDDGANYCQRCGAFLVQPEPAPAATTATYKVGETGELEELQLDEAVAGGAALVIRAGGGRAGESFPLQGDRLTIGRRPDSDVFLDDVTVSRDHAILVPKRMRAARVGPDVVALDVVVDGVGAEEEHT